MAVDTDVFVGFEGTLSDLVSELRADNIALKFVPDVQDHSYDRYEWQGDGVDVVVANADGFDNDRDMAFSDYQYFISITALRLGRSDEDWRKWDERRERFARDLFGRLKATGKYRLMLIHDMQRKLDEFQPAALVPLIAR